MAKRKKVESGFVVVKTRDDIPKELRMSIIISNDKLVFQTNRGAEEAPLGSTIGFRKSEYTSNKFHCWLEKPPRSEN